MREAGGADVAQVGHQRELLVDRQERERRGAAPEPAYGVGGQRLHGDDDVGGRDRVRVELGARLGVLLVGQQRVPARVGLDRDLVAEPGQLADELGHHRDARLALTRLLGHGDPHGRRTLPRSSGRVRGNVSMGTWRGRPRGPSPRCDSTSVTASTGQRGPAYPSSSRTQLVTSCGNRVRATVRCAGSGRRRPRSRPGSPRRGSRWRAGPARCGRPRRGRARSRSPSPGRRSGRRRRR